MADQPIAEIREQITFTPGGRICLIFLVLNTLLCGFGWFALNGAVQQAAVGTAWIAGNVLWGLGAALGRRRTYTVYRVLPSQQHE